MWILVAVATTLFIAVDIFTLYFDHMTSGKYKKGYGDVISCVGGIIVLSWGFSGQIVQFSPLLVVIALSAIIRTISYAWYCGPLKDVRRHRVEKLRFEWQKELAWLDDQAKVLEEEALALMKCSSSAVRDHDSQHNAWVVKQDARRRIALLRKIKYIVP